MESPVPHLSGSGLHPFFLAVPLSWDCLSPPNPLHPLDCSSCFTFGNYEMGYLCWGFPFAAPLRSDFLSAPRPPTVCQFLEGAEINLQAQDQATPAQGATSA